MGKTTFIKKPEQKKIFVSREFDGTLEQVWKAWTDKDILDQWWAPEPWRAETKSMDFREGGTWLYSMVGPDGTRMWAKFVYKKIQPNNYFDSIDKFCDEQGNDAPGYTGSQWHSQFTSTPNGTQVNVELTFETEEELHKMVEMGFVEGFEMAHGNLDRLLANKKL